MTVRGGAGVCLTPDIVKITTPPARAIILLAADTRQEQVCVRAAWCDPSVSRTARD